MLRIRALATFLRFWHDLMRVAYQRRRRIIAQNYLIASAGNSGVNSIIRTEQVYVDWIRRYILLHHKRHPEEMGE